MIDPAELEEKARSLAFAAGDRWPIMPEGTRGLYRHLAAKIIRRQRRDSGLYPCGHPKTPENSRAHGKRKDGSTIYRCRTCRLKIDAASNKRRRGK